MKLLYGTFLVGSGGVLKENLDRVRSRGAEHRVGKKQIDFQSTKPSLASGDEKAPRKWNFLHNRVIQNLLSTEISRNYGILKYWNVSEHRLHDLIQDIAPVFDGTL